MASVDQAATIDFNLIDNVFAADSALTVRGVRKAPGPSFSSRSGL
jgi:hypothetical protein